MEDRNGQSSSPQRWDGDSEVGGCERSTVLRQLWGRVLPCCFISPSPERALPGAQTQTEKLSGGLVCVCRSGSIMWREKLAKARLIFEDSQNPQ